MNSVIKVKLIAFFVLATALVASWPARAETMYLKCGTVIITVDLTKNTVSYSQPSAYVSAVNLAAKIGVTDIDWQWHSPTNSNGYDIEVNHIDRTTGNWTSWFVFYHPDGSPNGQSGADTVSCTKTAKPNTQF